MQKRNSVSHLSTWGTVQYTPFPPCLALHRTYAFEKKKLEILRFVWWSEFLASLGLICRSRARQRSAMQRFVAVLQPWSFFLKRAQTKTLGAMYEWQTSFEYCSHAFYISRHAHHTFVNMPPLFSMLPTFFVLVCAPTLSLLTLPYLFRCSW